MEPQAVPQPQTSLVPPTPQAKNSLVLIMSVLLIITVGIAGLFYFQIQKLSKELSKYQTQTTPTPTASQAPNGDLANWKTYTNTQYNYSFKYPTQWDINQQSIGDGILVGQGEPNEDQINLNVSSTKSEAMTASCKQIQQILLDNITASKCEFTQEITTERAIVYNPPITSKTVYIEAFHNGLYYTISLVFNQTSDKFKILDQILSTFKFLDQNSQTSSCAPKFKVESGPELTASEAYSQKCYEAKTREGCEKVDIYRESTQNFGDSDGIPDCSWTESK